MSRVIVIGAGFSGSAAALMLAADGHQVVVVDRDAGPLPAGPDEAWKWDRRSIRQYRFAHGLLPRGHRLMAQHFPHLVERLRQVGGLEINLGHAFVDLVPGSTHRPDDDRFGTVTARRPTFDWVWASALADEPAISVCRGVPVVGLLRGADIEPGVAHVAGVRLADGSELPRRPRRGRQWPWFTPCRAPAGHRCAAAADRRARQRVRLHRPLLPLPRR